MQFKSICSFTVASVFGLCLPWMTAQAAPKHALFDGPEEIEAVIVMLRGAGVLAAPTNLKLLAKEMTIISKCLHADVRSGNEIPMPGLEDDVKLVYKEVDGSLELNAVKANAATLPFSTDAALRLKGWPAFMLKQSVDFGDRLVSSLAYEGFKHKFPKFFSLMVSEPLEFSVSPTGDRLLATSPAFEHFIGEDQFTMTLGRNLKIESAAILGTDIAPLYLHGDPIYFEIDTEETPGPTFLSASRSSFQEVTTLPAWQQEAVQKAIGQDLDDADPTKLKTYNFTEQTSGEMFFVVVAGDYEQGATRSDFFFYFQKIDGQVVLLATEDIYTE